MKITSDLTNLTTAILILTVQMFIEWTLSNPAHPPFLLKNVLYCTYNAIGCSFKFPVKVGVEESIVNAPLV
jgi:hypothetical protein